MTVAHTTPVRADDGFTVLELLIALVILSFTLAVSIPQMTKRSDTAALRSAALQFAANLRTTRASAMSTNAGADLIVDLAAKRYWAEGAVKAHALPKTVQILAGNNIGNPAAVSRAAIHFNADGSSNGGWIGLTTQRARADISVDWMTGATRVRFGR
jgi:general secretion pathway protein H